MEKNKTRGIPTRSSGKTQEVIDLQMKKMLGMFLIESLRSWKANRSHPILKTVSKPRSGKVIWDSNVMGTYIKSIHGNMSAAELANLRMLKEQTA